MDADRLTDLYRKMLTVRALEKKVEELVFAGAIPCSGHFGLGQEAAGVGVGASLRTEDYLFPTHRGFAEYIGKGLLPVEILAEYHGKADSLSRGRIGQHLLKPEIGIMPLPSSLGSEFGMAVGAALSSRLLGQGRVALNLFGEGTAGQGDLGPSIEMAALWKLPLVFVCTNNQYVELDHYRNVVAAEDVAPRAAAYGVPFEILEIANDVEAVVDIVSRAVEHARDGNGPTFLELKTYRRCTHYTGDPGGYQDEAEIAEWVRKDPVDRCRTRLESLGEWDETRDEKLRAEIADEIAAALEAVQAMPDGDPATLGDTAYA